MGDIIYCEEEPGDTIEEILSYVHIDSSKMRETWSRKLNEMNISNPRKNVVLLELEHSLQSSSYLN